MVFRQFFNDKRSQNHRAEKQNDVVELKME